MDKQLTEHFKLSGFLVSSSRPDLVTPPEEVPSQAVAHLKKLATEILEPIREHFGKPLTPSSGYRNDTLNSAVGGSPTSQHRFGQACDFRVSGVPHAKVFDWIRRESSLPYGQLILYKAEGGYTRFIHVALPSHRHNRHAQVKTDGCKDYVTIQPEDDA